MTHEHIRLLLAVSQELFGESLQSLLELESDMQVVGIATTGVAAVALATQQQPAIVLIDSAFSDLTGVAATAQIRRTAPTCQIIFLAPCADVRLAAQAANAGALSYILTTSPSVILLDAIRAAAHGDIRVDPAVGSSLFQQCATPITASKFGDAARNPTLTPREVEVFRLVQQGQSNRAIAQQLCISESTVKKHVSHVRLKTGISDWSRR